MKKVITLVVLAAILTLATPGNVAAHDYQKSSDNPIRVLVYPIHAFGTMLEWAIFRPIHRFVSAPHMRILFGHTVNENDIYWEWEEYR